MRIAFALIFAWALVAAGVARANDDPDTEVARRHFNLGRTYYDGAEYEKALGEFEAAKRVRPHPALDYNIARCLDRLERYQPAIDAYEHYIGSNPADVAEMRERVKVLKERLAAAPPPVVPPPTVAPPTREVLLVPVDLAAPPPPPPHSHKRTLAIVFGVLGGAALIGAGVAVGLLVKPTVGAATPDSIGGPHRGTQ
jgi:tetratricopeptide (TPR) repeat protein